MPDSSPNLLKAALWYAKHYWFVVPDNTPLFDALDSHGQPTICTCEDFWRYTGTKRKPANPDFSCLKPGKHPRLSDWENKATIDPATINKWWRRWPNANIGIAAGKSGLVVLDLDLYQEGAGDLALSQEEQETITSLTGGGGQHLIFKHPEHGPLITNSDNKLPDWVNIRAHGGQFVVPPSMHKSGRRYEWEAGYGPHEF